MEKWGKILMWAGVSVILPPITMLWAGLESRREGWSKCSYWQQG